MNTLGKLWVSGSNPFESLTLEFVNKELVWFMVEWNKTNTKEEINNIVNDLIEQKMITFFDDIPEMSVIVNITDIPSISESTGRDKEMVYIETFHYDQQDEMIDRDNCDVPKPLHEFMGIETPIMLSDI